MSLPEEDRAALARDLVDSLPDFKEDFDPEIQREWIDRAKLSQREIQASTPTYTLDEVFTEVDQKIRDAR